MRLNVIKRDGSEVDFNLNKIIMAITKANKEVTEEERLPAEEIEAIAKEIQLFTVAVGGDISIEEIQDMVENGIIQRGKKEVAKKYIRYRYLHAIARDKYNAMMKAVGEKLYAKNVKNQNANVDEHSFGGRQGEAQSLVNKQFAMEYLLSDMVKQNHLNNEVYIHDLDSYAIGSHNCLSIPFDDLLKNGFNTRQTDVRPAGSVSTAFQLIAVIFQLQSLQQFGGVSATHLDWTMVPYVRKSFSKHFKKGMKYLLKDNDPNRVPKELSFDDEEANDPHYKDVYKYAMDMIKQEIHQSVEALYHNLNTLTY